MAIKDDMDATLDTVRLAIKDRIAEGTGYILLLVIGGKLGFASNLENSSTRDVLAAALERESNRGGN